MLQYQHSERTSDPSSFKIHLSWTVQRWVKNPFLSASLYFSKRGAYWHRLCRDVVSRWSLVIGWLSRACTVAKRCIL